MKKSILILIVAVSVVLSCRKAHEEPLSCFEDDVRPILVSHCGIPGCHNPQDHAEGIDLTNYDEIIKHVHPGKPGKSEIHKVIKEGEMPPAGYTPVTDDQLLLIDQWISFGAQNNANCHDSGCDTTTVTFSAGVKPILEQNCNGCHNGHSQIIPYDFTNISDVQLAATSGDLYGAITHDPNYIPMPSNGNFLHENCIKVIYYWIAAGAQNN